MSWHRRIGTLVLAASVTAGLTGCQPRQAEQAKPDIPEKPICDIIPRKPVAELFNSTEMHVVNETNLLTRDRSPYYNCTIAKESLEPAFGKIIDAHLQPEEEYEYSEVPNGVEVMTPLGPGSVAPRRAYVYPTCNGRHYWLYVQATYHVGKGNREAIEQIALAVVDALDKAQDCRAPTTAPSASPGPSTSAAAAKR